MMTHKFTLILSGIADLEPQVADALFEATGGDIELNMCNHVPYVEFSRQAPSLDEAVRSAIHDVEKASLGIRVVRVETASANIIAKINADLLGVAFGK